MPKIKDTPKILRPREIFHPAVELNSASIILVHNHLKQECKGNSFTDIFA